MVHSDSKGQFACQYPGCNATYRRKEHLKRHEAQHNQRQSFNCSICGHDFRRSDTLRRHVRRNHKINEPIRRVRQACANCRGMKSRCEGGAPCSECLRRKTPCSLTNRDEVAGTESSDKSIHRTLPPNSLFSSQPHRHEKERQALRLYFELFHPHWPFVHQGSFNAPSETPLLLQAMVAIGLWVSGEQSAQSVAIDLHKMLNVAIHQQKDRWDASVAENACSSCTWPIPTYQAILLHIIFSMIHKDDVHIGLDLMPTLPSADADLLKSLVLSCKKLGMFYYPNMLARFQEDDLPSYVWVSIEEIKRFDLALYKVWKILGNRDNQKRGATGVASQELEAVELQFPLPKNDPLWNATTKHDWLAAITEDAEYNKLHDTREEEWISKSAKPLGVVEFSILQSEDSEFVFNRQYFEHRNMLQ